MKAPQTDGRINLMTAMEKAATVLIGFLKLIRMSFAPCVDYRSRFFLRLSGLVYPMHNVNSPEKRANQTTIN